MVFLIEYARSQGRVVQIRPYRDDERLEAENARLELELELNRQGIDHEVVLLDAASREALRLTHSRYFPVAEWPEPEIEWPKGDFPDQDPQGS